MPTNLRIKTPSRRWRRNWYGYNLFRVCWENGEPGDGVGYSNKLSVGLSPRWFGWLRQTLGDLEVYLLGLRVHYSRSYGGRFG